MTTYPIDEKCYINVARIMQQKQLLPRPRLKRTVLVTGWGGGIFTNNQSGDRHMNEVNETLREINITIAFYKRKILACEAAIESLENEKREIMKKYNIPGV